jgi:hypothetical protein
MLCEEGKKWVNVLGSIESGGIRKKRDAVRFPVCLGQHILLSCLEMRMWRKEVVSRK